MIMQIVLHFMHAKSKSFFFFNNRCLMFFFTLQYVTRRTFSQVKDVHRGGYLDKILETIRSRFRENPSNGFIPNTSSFTSKIEIKL